MGPHQYSHHSGSRDNRSTSGAQLWAEIEAHELNSGAENNIFHSEDVLIRRVARDLRWLIPAATTVMELGPGTPLAFRKKTLPILGALSSIDYVCVDESAAFLSGIKSDTALSQYNVKTIQDDFFEGNRCYLDIFEGETLACLFGSTIGNIPAPVSVFRPHRQLSEHLSTIAGRIQDGWVLLTYDTNHDGPEQCQYYKRHKLFHLNVFDRMAVDLPIVGDFDPCAFEYEPLWVPSSGQMAHLAVVLRDMSFDLAGKKINLKNGQKLHLKNSFKFTHSFFAQCCERANLEIVKTWSEPGLSSVYCLLRKAPQNAMQLEKSLLASNYAQ